MEEIGIKAGQLLLSLSILVVLHELGHFIPAKLFKTRVEKFYLFFNPWFSLFKYKKGDTEYGIGWLPLGGYVKISGMIDESMDKEQMGKEPESWEFRSKPAWQRLIIMAGGVTVNLILGGLIYTLVLFAYGDKYLPNKSLSDGIWCIDSLAYDMGLQNGDKILSLNGNTIERFDDIPAEMLYGGSMLVDRSGQLKEIEIPANFIEKLIDGESRRIIYPRFPMIIAQIPSESHNANAGLEVKDRILSVNEIPVKYFDEFKTILQDFKNEEVTLSVLRDNETLSIKALVNDDGLIGIAPFFYSYQDMIRENLYEFHNIKYGFFESIPAGINKAYDKLSFYIKQFKLILNPETGAYKGIGGFGAIGGLFPPVWNWQAFWEITAFLSLILAFMNLLPIPALDGGHIMFLFYEIISGRAPSQKFLEYAQIAGMVLLFSLLIFANGNDLFRAFK